MSETVEPWELRFKTGDRDSDARRRLARRMPAIEPLIAALALRGMPAGDIAVAVGMSEVRVQMRLSRYKLTRSRGKPRGSSSRRPVASQS